MNSYVSYTKEETDALIRSSKDGDETAKAKLIEINTPLIKSIIKRYKNKGVEYDDLFQLGSLGFLKAINNYDFSYEVKFSTYAVPMIAGEVKRFLRDDGYIKISRVVKTLALKINMYLDEIRKNALEEPTISELAKKFEASEQDIVFAMDASKLPISLFEKVDENTENSQSVIDKIVSEDENDKMINYLDLKTVIKDLSEREKKIIILRYYRDKTQSEIAKHLGVSQVQISRLENKILKKLRNKLEK